MKSLVSIILLLILMVYNQSVFAQSSITVGNPLSNWPQHYTESPHLDTAQVILEPIGKNIKTTLKLTFSVDQTNLFNPSAWHELYWRFSLPGEAKATDMKLWVGDTIMPSYILDNNEASFIYNTIVGRRVDPSLLTKDNQNYTLFVYPICDTLPRTLSLEFLIPAKSNGDSFYTTTIFKILGSIADSNTVFNLGIKEVDGIKNFALLGSPNSGFINFIHPNYGALKWTTIDLVGSSLTFEYEWDNPIPFFYYADPNSSKNFFNFFINVSDELSIPEPPKKILYLIDYDLTRGAISFNEIIEGLKQSIGSNLNPQDSINVLFGLSEILLESNWISSDTSQLNQKLSSFAFPLLGNGTNFFPSIMKAIQFINQNGNKAHIIVLSNDENLYPGSQPQFIKNKIENSLTDSSSISIISLSYQNQLSNLYQYLGASTPKIKYRISWDDYNSFTFELDEEYLNLKVPFEFLSVEVTTPNNTPKVFNSYNQTNRKNGVQNSFSGFFTGNFPVSASVKAIDTANNVYQKNYLFDLNDANQASSIVSKLFYAEKIDSLDIQPYFQGQDSLIVEKSINSRVMHDYTAFLCLEPGMNIPFGLGEIDGGVPVSIFPEKTNSKISIYPNPTSELVFVELLEPATANVEIKILDLSGKVLNTQVIQKESSKISIRTSDFPPGLYFISIDSKIEKEVFKLIIRN